MKQGVDSVEYVIAQSGKLGYPGVFEGLDGAGELEGKDLLFVEASSKLDSY